MMSSPVLDAGSHVFEHHSRPPPTFARLRSRALPVRPSKQPHTPYIALRILTNPSPKGGGPTPARAPQPTTRARALPPPHSRRRLYARSPI